MIAVVVLHASAFLVDDRDDGCRQGNSPFCEYGNALIWKTTKYRRPSRAGGPRPAPYRRRPLHGPAAGQHHDGARDATLDGPGWSGRRAALVGLLRCRRTPSRRGRPGVRNDEPPPSTIGQVRRHLVGLKRPRALEVLDHTMRQLERGEIGALEAIDTLRRGTPLREARRVKAALEMGRLLSIKTLAGFGFGVPALTRPQPDLRLRAAGVHRPL